MTQSMTQDTTQDPPRYTRYDRGPMPVTAMAVDYPSGHTTTPHQHPTAQLIHAVQGVMLVATHGGQWIVPPTRGIWMPANTTHWIRMIGDVRIRTAYIRPDAIPDLPVECKVLGITPLLRELILAAIDIAPNYADDSRNGRLTRLILDELLEVPTLALHLPNPSDPRLKTITHTMSTRPDDDTTAAQWAKRLHVDPKTIHRLFARETGMTFGQWRQQSRLLTALERLAQGEKILNVALELGYSSPSAFAAMFKKQFGVPPSEFFG